MRIEFQRCFVSLAIALGTACRDGASPSSDLEPVVTSEPPAGGEGDGDGDPEIADVGPELADAGVDGTVTLPGPPGVTTPAGSGPDGSTGTAPADAGSLADAQVASGTPSLPTTSGDCPNLSNLDGQLVEFRGTTLMVWSGSKSSTQHGPLVFYWRPITATLGALDAVGPFIVPQLRARGGILVQPFPRGTGSPVSIDWTTGDLEVADELVACAVKQLAIDPRHIHTVGYGTGADMAADFARARSSYVASIVAYSGGPTGARPQQPVQDSSHTAAALVIHGSAEDENDTSTRLYRGAKALVAETRAAGAAVVECEPVGSALRFDASLQPAAADFVLTHGFGAASPYQTRLPAQFPTSCRLVP